MSNDHSLLWKQLEANLGQALSIVEPSLALRDPDQLQFVQEMLREGEYGLTLEHLCTALFEAGTPVERRA
jgi:hypothetical protein